MRFLILCLLSLCLLNACFPYGMYEDERSFGTILDDNALIVAVNGRLLEKNFGETFSVSVHCFNGHVFLVGDIDPEFKKEALQIARTTDQVKKVSVHWFAKPSKSLTDDIATQFNVAEALINAKGISSTQVELEVHNGHVILLGVVANKAIANRIIAISKTAKGVTKVTSYLLY